MINTNTRLQRAVRSLVSTKYMRLQLKFLSERCIWGFISSSLSWRQPWGLDGRGPRWVERGLRIKKQYLHGDALKNSASCTASLQNTIGETAGLNGALSWELVSPLPLIAGWPLGSSDSSFGCDHVGMMSSTLQGGPPPLVFNCSFQFGVCPSPTSFASPHTFLKNKLLYRGAVDGPHPTTAWVSAKNILEIYFGGMKI